METGPVYVNSMSLLVVPVLQVETGSISLNPISPFVVQESHVENGPWSTRLVTPSTTRNPSDTCVAKTLSVENERRMTTGRAEKMDG